MDRKVVGQTWAETTSFVRLNGENKKQIADQHNRMMAVMAAATPISARWSFSNLKARSSA
jgi:hypothetical protein